MEIDKPPESQRNPTSLTIPPIKQPSTTTAASSNNAPKLYLFHETHYKIIKELFRPPFSTAHCCCCWTKELTWFRTARQKSLSAKNHVANKLPKFVSYFIPLFISIHNKSIIFALKIAQRYKNWIKTTTTRRWWWRKWNGKSHLVNVEQPPSSSWTWNAHISSNKLTDHLFCKKLTQTHTPKPFGYRAREFLGLAENSYSGEPDEEVEHRNKLNQNNNRKRRVAWVRWNLGKNALNIKQGKILTTNLTFYCDMAEISIFALVHRQDSEGGHWQCRI